MRLLEAIWLSCIFSRRFSNQLTKISVLTSGIKSSRIISAFTVIFGIASKGDISNDNTDNYKFYLYLSDLKDSYEIKRNKVIEFIKNNEPSEIFERI